jgi:hypothetical protein
MRHLALEHNRYRASEPGETRRECLVEAWRGAKPSRPKELLDAVADGDLVLAGIQTEAIQSRASAEDQQKWVLPAGGYDRELALAEHPMFLRRLLRRAHGRREVLFSPPRLGAEHAGGFQFALRIGARRGWLAFTGPIREADAYWADDSSHSILRIAVALGRHKVLARERLARMARIVVPAYGL